MEGFNDIWQIALAFGILWALTDGIVLGERRYGPIRKWPKQVIGVLRRKIG